MFRRKPPEPEVAEWVIVGLGNPGPQYRGTRHNVGFEVIDLLAARHHIKVQRSKHQALYGFGAIEGVPVVLVKPLTYMNLSGNALAAMARSVGVAPSHILVVADDLDLPVGRIRLKPKGSAGGHGGHKSIIERLGTSEYPRVKIGIGRTDKSETIDHVLGSFSPEERQDINEAIQRAAHAVEVVLQVGVERAMSRVNAGPQRSAPDDDDATPDA